MIYLSSRSRKVSTQKLHNFSPPFLIQTEKYNTIKEFIIIFLFMLRNNTIYIKKMINQKIVIRQLANHIRVCFNSS